MFDDYPQSATTAAKRALRHRDENGTGCGTRVGWVRANQLANREALSADTVKRTFSFLSRHKKNNTGKFTSNKGEVCGSVMYAAWGGTSMLTWARKKIKEMEQKERAKVGEMDGVPVFTTLAEAKQQAEKMGCSGTHEHLTDDGKTVYMPCASHEDATTGTRSANVVQQRRAIDQDIEVRMHDEDEGATVSGYAAVFNSVTDLGTFKEQIAPDAFTRALSEEHDVVALLNHDNNFVLGRTKSGTLKLEVDERGLKYEVKLGSQSYAKDLAESMRRGDIYQSSFAFTIERESWQENVRTVEEVRGLYDVSVVTRPAYKDATADVRSCGCNAKPPQASTKQEKKTNTKTESPKLVATNSFRMKNSDQLKSVRANKLTELNALVEVAEAEGRDYTEAEVQRQEVLNNDIKTLDAQIVRAENTEANVQRFAQMGAATPKAESVEVDKLNARYDLGKALRQASQGRLDGVENELHQEALREAAAGGIQLRGNVCIPQAFIEQRNVYGVDSAQNGVADAVTNVATDVAPLVGALRPNPIIAELGATQLSGFVGDIKLPTLPNDGASTPVEGGDATAFAGAMGSATLSPQRFAAQITLSKEALNQSGGNMSDVIARDFGRAIGNKIDEWAFAQLIGSTAELSGGIVTPAADALTGDATIVLASQNETDNIAKTSAADVMRLWSTIAANGIEGEGKFLMRPALAGHLMAEPLSGAGSVPVMSGNQIAGYEARFSQNLPRMNGANIGSDLIVTGGGATTFGDVNFDVILFGDWSQVFWATWGGLSLTIDPFSGATAGNVKIVADQYFDAKLRHAGAIGYLPAGTANIAGGGAD